MAGTEVVYFSGTGNSLAIARYVAGKLGGKLTPAIQAPARSPQKPPADTLGLVFPIYDFRPPRCIFDVLETVPDIEAKYLFAICTHGTAAPGRSLKRVQ